MTVDATASFDAQVVVLDDGVIVVRHDELAPPKRLLEVRGDGLWAELVCEVPGEHWTFGLEAFGVRLDDEDEAAPSDVGERVPVGFDLEWEKTRSSARSSSARAEFDLDTRRDVRDQLGAQCAPGAGRAPSTRYASTASSMQCCCRGRTRCARCSRT